MTQAEKGDRFRALHLRDRAFVLPNPWDLGTARVLEHLGFEALATTSSGFAFSVARQDNTVVRQDAIAHIAAMASATALPINADLENGFGDTPETCAETIRLAAHAGAARSERFYARPAKCATNGTFEWARDAATSRELRELLG